LGGKGFCDNSKYAFMLKSMTDVEQGDNNFQPICGVIYGWPLMLRNPKIINHIFPLMSFLDEPYKQKSNNNKYFLQRTLIKVDAVLQKMIKCFAMLFGWKQNSPWTWSLPPPPYFKLTQK